MKRFVLLLFLPAVAAVACKKDGVDPYGLSPKDQAGIFRCRVRHITSTSYLDTALRSETSTAHDTIYVQNVAVEALGDTAILALGYHLSFRGAGTYYAQEGDPFGLHGGRSFHLSFLGPTDSLVATDNITQISYAPMSSVRVTVAQRLEYSGGKY